MDTGYKNSVVVRLSTGTFFQEPNIGIKTPKAFKKYITHEGENIFMLANRFYQDTTYWYAMCKFSGIVDPTDIRPGSTILLPIYDDKSPEDIFV